MNTRNAAAANGVNRPESAWGRVAILVPVSTARVLTTASLAVNPVISAVEIRQSLKPKRHEYRRDQPADVGQHTLGAGIHHIETRVSKVCKNQMTNSCQKDNGKGSYNKILCLVPNAAADTLLELGRR